MRVQGQGRPLARHRRGQRRRTISARAVGGRSRPTSPSPDARLKDQRANTPPKDLGGWFWESGFDKDPINDIERIRDLNMRAMYGAWDALKNVDGLYPNHRIGWSAFIAGKRESRRLLGDVILTADDFRKGTVFPDAAFPCTWHIDVHTPHPQVRRRAQGRGVHFHASPTARNTNTKAPTGHRTARSTAGTSATSSWPAATSASTREALGAVRVMRTTGMMGEIVGKAAWICVRHETIAARCL